MHAETLLDIARVEVLAAEVVSHPNVLAEQRKQALVGGED